MVIQVKCFDEEHEQLLEEVMNEFLATLSDSSIIEIKFSVSHFEDSLDHEQVFSYAAMVIYQK